MCVCVCVCVCVFGEHFRQFKAAIFSKLANSTSSAPLQDLNAQITWENPDEVDLYISKLQKSADKLTSQNRRLRHCHATLADKVVKLMSVDLLRQQQKWKDTLGEMRSMMTSLIQEVCTYVRTYVCVQVCVSVYVFCISLFIIYVRMLKLPLFILTQFLHLTQSCI